MNETDLYAVLQVAPDASSEDIRRAYRALLRSHHPDLNPDGGGSAPPDGSAPRDRESRPGERTTAAILHAYMVLGDAERRAGYDRNSSRRITARHHKDSGESGVTAAGESGAAQAGESAAAESGAPGPPYRERPQRRANRGPAVPSGRPVYLGFDEPLSPDAVRLGESSPSSSGDYRRRWIVFDR